MAEKGSEKDSLDERESGRESCNLSGKDRREREAERERKDSHKKGYYNKAPGLGQDSQMFSQTSKLNNRMRIVLCT